jgi:two-component system response regulator YesN
MVYKTLIADDEEIIREGIAKILSSDEELSIVCLAGDGEVALEQTSVYLPDLLFVDIDMPFMNGLEFIEKLSSILSGAVVVIITGYDDFALVQKALRLGVFDYLLKPVMEASLFSVVERAKTMLSQNSKRVKYLKWAEMQIEKNMSELKTLFFSGWLNGRFSEPEIAEQLEYLKINIRFPCGVTIARITFSESLAILEKGWDETLIYYAAENIAVELFGPIGSVYSYKNDSGDLVLLSQCEPADHWAELGLELLDALRKYLPVKAELLQITCDSEKNLSESYLTAMERFGSGMKCSQLICETKNYVLQNYADTDLSLQTAAARYFVSPEHLSRVFRHETGVTFVDFVTQTRIRKAIEWLLNSDLKIHEVAHKVGYSTQHYFSIAFKRVLGVSPAEYRRKADKPG